MLFVLVAFGCSANSTPGAQLTDSGTAADSQTSTTSTDTSSEGADTADPSDTAMDGDIKGPHDVAVPDTSKPDTSKPDEDPWVAVGPDLIDGVSEDLTAVYVTNDASAVWAVGDTGRVISKSLDKGDWLSWQTRSKADLRGVGADADGEVFVVGTGGYIGRLVDGGFDTETSGTTENLNAVWFSSQGVSHQGFAVGDAGTLLSTSSLGDWWNMVAFTDDGELVSHMNDVHGDGSWNDGNVFAVGDGGVVMKFNGKHWAQEIVAPGESQLEDLIAITSHDGTFWAAGDGGLIVQRSDSAVWEAQPAVPTGKSLVVDMTVFGGAPVAVALHAVLELDGSEWVVVNESLTGPNAAASDKTGIWVVGAQGLVTYLEPLKSL
ncbi:MAG: hypothetical protein ACI9OJ_003965 [Myxococcota bacterium]